MDDDLLAGWLWSPPVVVVSLAWPHSVLRIKAHYKIRRYTQQPNYNQLHMIDAFVIPLYKMGVKLIISSSLQVIVIYGRTRDYTCYFITLNGVCGSGWSLWSLASDFAREGSNFLSFF